MPTYPYLCKTCGIESEGVFKIADRPATIPCCKCGKEAVRILASSGGIQRDVPTWLDSANQLLMPDDPGVKHPESRGEFNQYLKDNGIVQKA